MDLILLLILLLLFLGLGLGVGVGVGVGVWVGFFELVIWSIYILRCGDGTLYTGVATDVARRFEEHSSQGPKAAKYVRGRTPVTLVYSREVGSRSDALKEEWRIKQLSRAAKEDLLLA